MKATFLRFSYHYLESARSVRENQLPLPSSHRGLEAEFSIPEQQCKSIETIVPIPKSIIDKTINEFNKDLASDKDSCALFLIYVFNYIYAYRPDIDKAEPLPRSIQRIVDECKQKNILSSKHGLVNNWRQTMIQHYYSKNNEARSRWNRDLNQWFMEAICKLKYPEICAALLSQCIVFGESTRTNEWSSLVLDTPNTGSDFVQRIENNYEQVKREWSAPSEEEVNIRLPKSPLGDLGASLTVALQVPL